MICPLCSNDVKEFHRRSHLIPEWMYTDCYDEGHKLISISKAEEKATRVQQGIYRSIICASCEKETQKYDHYASLVLTERSPMASEFTSVKKEYFYKNNERRIFQFAKWQGLDFKKFQNFVFSIILKSHFAKADAPPLLIKKHLERLLAIYKGAHLDDSSYPIVILEYPKSDELRNHIVLPYLTKKSGHHVIEFAGGGCQFNIFVSSHRKPRYAESLSLKTDGTIHFIIEPYSQTGLFRGAARGVQSIKKIPKNLY